MLNQLLDATGDSWGKKHIIVESLKLFEEEDIDLRFVSYMMKINENDRYYSSKPYILFFNEKIPTMEADENFQKYARYTCRRFVTAMENSNTEDQEKFGKRIKHLFSVFIRRLEHYVFDVWLLKELRKSLFEYLLDEETHELYEEKRVYHLLRLNMAKLKAKKKVVAQKLASELETLMENYELHSVRKEPSMDSSLQLFEKIKDHPIFG
ncbi:hypothetical protein BDF20DRAFT_849022 [Mycotypha africana]|uniref:uncharacterized protein n=1 Tax=Mycotypha africana TaxID=64632 RepID=UPI0022FFF7CA|nr:uncharacterized protein BDF20DRAFT_849022 [Mycotypha africana]KAI8987239.1 hypothetical protein BDF20DRAFT_849022 [Mycotypha africana]